MSDSENNQGNAATPAGTAAAAPPSKAHSQERAAITAILSITAVLVLGLLLFFYFNRLLREPPLPETRNYNGFDFTRGDSSWFTQWERDNLTYTLEFRHPPWDVENITVTGQVDARFQRPYTFITYDPTNDSSRQTSFVALAASDLTMMLKGIFQKEGVVAVCTKNMTGPCSTRPIVTCATNASVIYLKVSDEPRLILDGNCVTIQGKEEGMTMAADNAMYEWLGIIRK